VTPEGELEYAAAAITRRRPHRRLESRAQLRRDPRARRVHSVQGKPANMCKSSAQNRSLPDDFRGNRAWYARQWPRTVDGLSISWSFLAGRRRYALLRIPIFIVLRRCMTAPEPLEGTKFTRRMLLAKVRGHSRIRYPGMTRRALKHGAVLSICTRDFQNLADARGNQGSARKAISVTSISKPHLGGGSR